MSVEVANESGTAVDEEALSGLARFALARMRIHPQAELSILLVDAPAMEQLHLKWMDEPGPTDVLSFPMDELRPHAIAGPNRTRGRDEDEGEPVLLGDVVLCPTVAQQQGIAAGHSTDDELHLLATHGILHLLGYDHAEPAEEREMFSLQDEIVAAWQGSR